MILTWFSYKFQEERNIIFFRPYKSLSIRHRLLGFIVKQPIKDIINPGLAVSILFIISAIIVKCSSVSKILYAFPLFILLFRHLIIYYPLCLGTGSGIIRFLEQLIRTIVQKISLLTPLWLHFIVSLSFGYILRFKTIIT